MGAWDNQGTPSRWMVLFNSSLDDMGVARFFRKPPDSHKRGWLRDAAPVDWQCFFPIIDRVSTILSVVQDFATIHSTYQFTNPCTWVLGSIHAWDECLI
jgi:hypothetical protein